MINRTKFCVFTALFLITSGLQAARPNPPVLLDAGAQDPTVDLGDLSGYGTSSLFGTTGNDTCVVTSVADSGAGTLRDCIQQAVDGAGTTISFATGGRITLRTPLVIAKSHITIDGTTAPAPGVSIEAGGAHDTLTLNGYMDGSGAHDVLVQGLRFRGDWDRNSQGGDSSRQVIAVDCENRTGAITDLNVVFNKITVVNANDSGGDVWGECDGITFQYSLFAYNYHPQSISHSAGDQRRERISLHHNVYYSNEERMPQIRGNVNDIEIVSNIFAGWGLYGMRIRERDAAVPSRINLLDNLWLDYGAARCDLTTDCGADDGGFVLMNTPASVCYDAGNVFVAAETDRCAAGAEFARADTTTAPQRHTVDQLASELIPSPATPNVGMPYPTDEEQALLAEVRAQATEQTQQSDKLLPTEPEPEPEPLPTGSGTLASWTDAPVSACEAKLATQSCGDGVVFCPNNLAEIQTAIERATPGDAICIRGGIYQCPSRNGPCLSIPTSVNGSATARITLSEYPGENVVLRGSGDEGTWNGRTTNLSSAEGGNASGMTVSGDYWTVQGIRWEWFGEAWMSVKGSHVRIYDNDFQYAFRYGLQIGAGDATSSGDVAGVELKWNRIRNVYHHTAVYTKQPTIGASRLLGLDAAFNIVAGAGYEADGDKVPPGPNGDPAGGGNSDGLGTAVTCDDSGAVECLDNEFRYNFVLNAADDCFDNSGSGTLFMGNIGVGCGPEGNKGIKLFAARPNVRVYGNFFHQNGTGMNSGFELRNPGDIKVVNNGTAHSANKGFDGVGRVGLSRNNFAWQSDGNEYNSYPAPGSNDWNGDVDGNPGLSACSSTLKIDKRPLDDETLRPNQRLRAMMGQVAEACGPAAGSPLVNAGVVVPGVHCATADDDPTRPHNATDLSCLHWMGSAPDIGPFEAGLW